MDNYSVALFLHVVGTLGFFVALGLEWTGLWQMRSAVSPEQVRGWRDLLKRVRKVGIASMLTTVLTGIYMTATVWGGVAWIIVTLGSLALLIALAQVLTAPRMATLGAALVNEKTPSSQYFHNPVIHPLVWISIQTRVAISLGIVFLKIVKPDLAGSLLTIGAAIVLGVASALPVARHEQAQQG